MGDFTDATAQELDRQSDGLKNQAVHLRADAKDKIARAESLEEAARLLWHRGYIIDRDSAAAAAEVERLTAQLDEAVRLLRAEHLGLIDGEEANYAKDCTSCKFLRAAALNKEEA